MDRTVTDSLGRSRVYRGTILKPSEDENGYLLVGLSHNGTTKRVFIHRLVSEAFLENPEGKPTVNHIDGNKHNNHIENLEWATYKEQRDHAVRTGLLDVDKVRNHAKSFRKPVYNSDTRQEFESLSEAGRFYHVDSETVRNWIHHKYPDKPKLEYIKNR